MTKLIEIIGKPLSGEWGIDDETGTGIPVLRTTNFTNDGIVNYNDVVTRTITKKDITEKYLRSGDIIIEKSGGSDKQPVGRVIFFNGPGNIYLFNNFTGLLRVKDQSKWLPKYVFYSLFVNYLNGGTKTYENKTTGLHNLKLDSFVNNFEIVERSLPEQRQIAAVLDQISGLISLRRQQLTKLDELVKARFVEMFGDPVKNNFEWDTKALNDVCDGIGDGLHGTPEYTDDGDYPFINGNNLENGTIKITPSTKKVDKETYQKYYIELSLNAILISINGTLGKTAFYNGEKVMLGKSACYCNLKPNINREFVYGVMQTESFADYLDESSTKSTIKNVGLKAMRAYKMIQPPEDLQKQYVAFAKQIDQSKTIVQQSLEKLELLKKSLMQQYFE